MPMQSVSEPYPNLLLIDDDPDSRMLLAHLLKDECRVREAVDGEAGLALIQAQIDEGDGCNIDLVLMDLVMPGIGGIEALRQLKALPLCSDIPVIVLSSEQHEEALIEAFAAGAHDYITKPVRKVNLQARVGAAIRLKREMDLRLQREQELAEANGKLKFLAQHDSLTGCANRRYFEDRLSQEWLRMAREGKSLALVMVDIDDFKAYNDHFGHQEGDICLYFIAKVIQSITRRPADLAVRWGGEEFMLLLPDTDIRAACIVADQLLVAIRKRALPHPKARAAPIVTVSLGVASIVVGDNFVPDNLVAAADHALYQAKDGGRNRLYFNA
ncbi:MAG: diguanylate cyclase [Mariprofundales bacterium]|nr:diguanylate cyclase [Mariprofundales bacterium]